MLPNFINGNTKTASAFASSQGGTLGTLYDFTEKQFSIDTLNSIATTADYTDIEALIADITSSTDKKVEGNVFGNNTVYFGVNHNNNSLLEWIPVYISNDGKGNAILTLWLAYNELSGNQEISTWSDGTYSTTVCSSGYDGSYIRHYVLNGSTNYTKGWESGTAITLPALSEMQKFTDFTTGELAQYIVKPKDVSWQMQESTYANDPSYLGTDKNNYPNEWTNDNLWLTSISEVGTDATTGIWGVTEAQCANATLTWMRTAYTPYSYAANFILDSGAKPNYVYHAYNVRFSLGVRPALHLNLGVLLSNSKIPLTTPSAVNAEYKGSAYTVDEIASKCTWYDGTKMKLELVEGNLKDAGTYKFKVTSEDGYKFAGTPAEGESETVRFFNFTITPKAIDVNWTTEKTQVEDGDASFLFMCPVLNVTPEAQLLLSEVEYYLQGDCTTNGGNITVTGSPVTEIERDKNYYAVVRVRNEADKNNYTFNGNMYCLFNTYDIRTEVVISLTNSELTYDGSSHAAIAKVVTMGGETVTDIDLQYTYYAEGDTVGTEVAPTDAGTYKVVITIKPSSAEQYTTSGNTEFEFIINKADPVLDPSYQTTGLFADGDLPAISAGASSTSGTYAWDNPQQKLSAGTHSYSYTFTPTNPNYNTVTATVQISAAEANVKSITAELNIPDDVIIYDTDSPDDLRQWLTVTGIKDDGTVQEDLQGYVITTPSLTAGENVMITITYGDTAPCYVTIPKVVKCELASITAVYTPEKAVYTSTNINTLKQWLTVTGVNNDGSYAGEISSADCTLSYGTDNALTAGTIQVTVTYNGLTTTISVTVEEVKLASITASWLNSLEVDEITGKTPADKLRELIKVAGTNNDGSSYGEEITDYTLDPVLDGTTLTLYISYNGVNTVLTKEVEPEPEDVVKTVVQAPDFSAAVAYTGNAVDILGSWKYANLVTAVGNGKINVGTYDIILTLKDTDKYEWADTEGDSITLTYRIEPAVIRGSWNGNGTLELTSESYKGSFDGLFEFTYYDKDGNEVPADELVTGENYKVVATLTDTDNFVLADDLSALIDGEHEFTKTETSGSGCNGVDPFLFVLIGIVLVYIILIILLVHVIVKKRRQREEEEESDFEPDDDDDDDEEEDEIEEE